MKNPHEKALAGYEAAREAHARSGPYKSAKDAIDSPTFSAMHKARRALKTKNK